LSSKNNDRGAFFFLFYEDFFTVLELHEFALTFLYFYPDIWGDSREVQ